MSALLFFGKFTVSFKFASSNFLVCIRIKVLLTIELSSLELDIVNLGGDFEA